MIAFVVFLKNLCVLLYLVVKHLCLALIPRFFLYKKVVKGIVLITGGGKSLGRLLAIKLSSVGCVVIIWDINEKDGEQTVNLIRQNGGQGYFYFCNVANREEVYLAAKKVKDEVGPVSILINNAGVATGKSLLECPDELIEKTFSVNTLAHFWTCKAFLPDMMTNNHGHIVNVASLAGFAGICSLSSYCSSKSAAICFHESLFMELKRDKYYGVKTTLVCTWHMDTDMFKGVKLRLIPPLKANYVADRIIAAIRSNEEVAIIPWYFNLGITLKSMCPLSVFSKVVEMFGGYNCLDNLVTNL